jgi:hypothetical protein
LIERINIAPFDPVKQSHLITPLQIFCCIAPSTPQTTTHFHAPNKVLSGIFTFPREFSRRARQADDSLDKNNQA